jgi:hypothetical protein
MEEQKLKRKIKNLTSNLAQQEAERTGKDYHECISPALDEACRRLGVSEKEYIKIFI